MFQSLFSFAVKHRASIVRTWYTSYIILFSSALYGIYGMYYQISHTPLLYRFGLWTGRIGLVVYILTLLPGIFRRFRFQHKGVMVLMMYRRQIGIVSFLLVFNHFWIVRGVSMFFRKAYTFPPLNEVAGMIAYAPLLAMFLTSNDFAVKLLGEWWNRLHTLTYGVVWLVLLHVGFQRFSIWTVLAAGAVVLEILSFLYARKESFSRFIQEQRL